MLTEIADAPDPAARVRAEAALHQLLMAGKVPPAWTSNGVPVADPPPWLIPFIPPPGCKRRFSDGMIITTYHDGLIDPYLPPGHPLAAQ